MSIREEYNLITPSITSQQTTIKNVLTFTEIIITNNGNNYPSSTFYPDYVEGIPFPKGTFLLEDNILYFAYQDAPASTPTSDTAYWIELRNS